MSERRQYVTLCVADQLFAVAVTQVQEILEMRAIAHLPHAPAHLLGMIDVRGKGVPVVDLRLTLGFERAADTENTRILVLQLVQAGRDTQLGMRVDRVTEVTVLDDETLDPPPEIGAAWNAQVIAGIGRRAGEFVTVLDLDRLLGDHAAIAA